MFFDSVCSVVLVAGIENRCCGDGLLIGGGESGKATLEGELGAESNDIERWLAVSPSEISTKSI